MIKNKGFFLAETIIVLALVTTAIAFVFPNVSKLYENYTNTTKYYDQVEDLYALEAISEAFESEIAEKTKRTSDGKLGCKDIQNLTTSGANIISIIPNTIKTEMKLNKLYIVNYLSNPSSSDYELNKYLKRLKKTSYDSTSYRLIAEFKEGTEIRYASIKIPKPGTDSCY